MRCRQLHAFEITSSVIVRHRPLAYSVNLQDILRSPGGGSVLAMERGGRVLGPARTSFNDYVGTVAADDAAAAMDRPSLYELAQIDRDRYTILAIDLKVDGPVTAAVYAIDRGKHGISRHAEIVEIGHGRGEIPVVQFALPEPNVEEFIRHAFKRISVQLVTQAVRDHVLVVTEPSSTSEA
jgi:hypothetical protein